MTDKVTLIIKAANQSSVDQKLECDLDWKVLSLKEQISKTHPAKPSVGEQRLIYSGQLLQDSFALRTVLRHPSDNNEYTIHMVCSTTKSANAAHLDHSSNYSASSSNTPHFVNNEHSSHAEAIPESSNEGVRHRVTASEQIPALGVQQGFDTSVYSTFSQLPLPSQAISDPIQQMAVMQQMYAQYMASYMQYIQSGSVESGRIFQESVSPSGGPSTAGSSSVSDSENQEGPRPQPQVPNVQEAQRNAQGRLIQGGAVVEEEEEGGARDWLDYIYFASRMGVLLSIVYFYSTFTRFIVVAGITVTFYLYQCGLVRFRRAEAAQPLPQPPVPQPPVNQGDGNGAQPNAPPQPSAQPGPEENVGNASRVTLQDGEGEEGIRDGGESALEGGSGSSEEGAQNAAEGQQPSIRNPIMEDLPPQQPSFLSLTWTLLTTFFTSLIPEQHQII